MNSSEAGGEAMATAETVPEQHQAAEPAKPSGEAAPAPPSASFLNVSDPLAALGDFTLFSLSTILWCLRRRPAPGTLSRSMYFVGVKTAPVVVITGAFIGMVLAIYANDTFRAFGMASRQSIAVNLAIVRELGPVLVATMLAGRVGSAMAAELSTMRITEQADALACLGANPIHYLVVPRFLTCVLLIPLLTVLANFAGVLGGVLISVGVFNVDSHHYWRHTRGAIGMWDVSIGLIKPIFFGAAIALISCHRGLNSKDAGAEGVGRSATQAFVISFVAILVVDFFLSLFFNQLGTLLWGIEPMSFTPRE
jgi:phospholipid/cholesterol/gamma-HCH transport system permease protein